MRAPLPNNRGSGVLFVNRVIRQSCWGVETD
jgi:hypothetical protein